MLKYKLQLILAVALILMTGTAMAAPILIAHPGSADAAFDAGTVQKIFLGKSSTWSDGTRFSLTILKGGDVSDAFLKANVKKSQKQFSTFWKKAVFSGTGEMPAAFATEAEVVMHVSQTPGAIGYIDDGTPHDGVKVITIN